MKLFSPSSWQKKINWLGEVELEACLFSVFFFLRFHKSGNLHSVTLKGELFQEGDILHASLPSKKIAA